MKPRNNPTKHLLFVFLGLAVSVIPVTVAILSYFPIWLRRGDASILSGISLLLICLALVPFYKHIIKYMKSPSAPIMWLLIFLVFFMLSKIAYEMTVISFVGFITNLLGSFFFRLSKKYSAKENGCEGRA